MISLVKGLERAALGVEEGSAIHTLMTIDKRTIGYSLWTVVVHSVDVVTRRRGKLVILQS